MPSAAKTFDLLNHNGNLAIIKFFIETTNVIAHYRVITAGYE